MAYKLTIDFNEISEDNLDVLNETLSRLKFKSLRMEEVEGQVADRNKESEVEFIFSHFYSDYEYLIKEVTFTCEESTPAESFTYQVDVTVYENDMGTADTIAFHLAWCNEHPDRVIKSVKNYIQDKYIVYVIVSRKHQEGDTKTSNPFANEYDLTLRAMPENRISFEYERDFTQDQIEMLRKGHEPESTLDRWRWYVKGNVLYIHRTLTGCCIYEIDISTNTGSHHVTANNSDMLFCDEKYNRAILEVLMNKWLGITRRYEKPKALEG